MASAVPDPAVQTIQMLLECCSCTETLTKPRTLSCFHSFCHHCLEKFVATRREDAMKAGIKYQKSLNAQYVELSSTLKKMKASRKYLQTTLSTTCWNYSSYNNKPQSIKCQTCKAKDPATSKCVSCDKYLCGKCLEAHNNWSPFEDHVVLTMEDLAKPENRAKEIGKPRCEKHNKVLKFYCRTCTALVCRHCIDVNHIRPEHTWFPLADVVVEEKEALKTSSASFEKQINEVVECNRKIEHAKETLKNNAAKVKEAIMQQQQDILNAFKKKLEVQIAVLLDQVDMKYNEVNKSLIKQQADVKDYLERAKSSLHFAQNIISNGSDEEILFLKHEIETKAEMTEKERTNGIERSSPQRLY